MSGATATAPAARLNRDGVTRTGYLTLGTWGWFLYGFGALLPQLGEDQGVSRTVTSLHSVALALGGIIAGLAAVPLIRALRRRGAYVLGGTLVSAGAVLLSAGGAWTPCTLAGALVVGTGGSLLMNTTVATLSDHHGGQGAAALAEGNSVATATGLVSPLVVGAGIAAGLTWRPAVLLVIPFVAAVLLSLRSQPSGTRALDTAMPPRAQQSREPLPRAVWPVLVMIVFCVGVEFVMGAWTAALLRERTGASAAAAAAGVSAVIAGMTIGRVAAGRLALRRAPRPLLAAALLLTVAGWTVTWSSTALPIALAGLLVTGIGMSAQYPLSAALLMSMVSGDGDQRDRASGVMSIGIGVAAGAGPFALGALADATSTHTAFLVVPVLMVLALLMLGVTARGAASAQRDEDHGGDHGEQGDRREGDEHHGHGDAESGLLDRHG